ADQGWDVPARHHGDRRRGPQGCRGRDPLRPGEPCPESGSRARAHLCIVRESAMTEMTYAEALALGLTECLDADPRVVLINASFGGLTPHRNSFAVLRQKYADRITDCPIAELGYCGIAIGAAMTGLRPIVALSTAAFSFEAWPQIVNEAAVACYGSAGQVTAPVVFHMLTGIRGEGAGQRSHARRGSFCNAPGWRGGAPGPPADARGLRRPAALERNNPTVFIAHARLQGVKGAVDKAAKAVPFGVAEV